MNADSSDYEQAAASDAWSENSSYSGVNKNYTVTASGGKFYIKQSQLEIIYMRIL